MEISSSTQVMINLGTLATILGFIIKTSRGTSKFKENVEVRLCEMETRMNDHDKEEKENKTSERLARIEVDIQWIRQALGSKK